MSNFLATVGRPVQYIDNGGVTRAAIITDVDVNGFVSLKVFPPSGADYNVDGVKAHDDTFNGRKTSQAGSYRLTWQGR